MLYLIRGCQMIALLAIAFVAFGSVFATDCPFLTVKVIQCPINNTPSCAGCLPPNCGNCSGSDYLNDQFDKTQVVPTPNAVWPGTTGIQSTCYAVFVCKTNATGKGCAPDTSQQGQAFNALVYRDIPC
jgi:hypothetical protein